MALYYTIPGVDGDVDFAWHVGGGRITEGENVKFIQADGHELDLIKHNFSNLPMKFPARLVRWSGDMAKFIAMNIG